MNLRMAHNQMRRCRAGAVLLGGRLGGGDKIGMSGEAQIVVAAEV